MQPPPIPIPLLILAYLSLLPCLSLQLPQLPSRLLTSLAHFPDHSCFYPSWRSSLTDNVVFFTSPPPAPSWYTDRHLEGPGIHPGCTLHSWAGRPVHTQIPSQLSPSCPRKRFPASFCQPMVLGGMAELPRTLNSLHLIFKAFSLELTSQPRKVWQN